MLFDVHVHVFPPDVIKRIDRYLEKDEFLNLIRSSPKISMQPRKIF